MRLPLLLLRALVRDRRGATAIEYGLILAGIAVVIFGAARTLGESSNTMWSNIQTKVADATK